MTRIPNVHIDGDHLHPLQWRVRDAISPVWIAWDWRPKWWSLLLCEQGIAAFQWPAVKLWRTQFKLAVFRHSAVVGDSWPMNEHSVVPSPSVLAFARDQLTSIQVNEGRFIRNNVALFERNGQSCKFAIADRGQTALCARLLRRHFGDAVQTASKNV